MISKELLSEVLENEVPYQVKVHKIIIKNNSLNYFYNSKDNSGGLFEANEYINIYELAHKCKEWLEYNCFYDVMIVEYEVYLMEDIWGECGAYSHKRFTSENSWILNLFKACQYTMENKCGS